MMVLLKGIKIFIIIILVPLSLTAQHNALKGQLIAKGDVEGIHILNKTASTYDISTEDGRFTIMAKVNDTLIISGIKYQLKELIVTTKMLKNQPLVVQLEEQIIALSQVVLGTILTGSLEADVQNSEATTALNFYDLGIPGSTKLPMTQNERRLFDATSGGFGIFSLINMITGRTKKLKAIVAIDDRNSCITRLRNAYEDIIFETVVLEDNLRNEYFLFAEEDPKFLELCQNTNDIDIIDFLKQKLDTYLKNRTSGLKD